MAMYTRRAAAATERAVKEAARAATAAEKEVAQTGELVKVSQDQVAAAHAQADAAIEALHAESQPLLVTATGLEDEPTFVSSHFRPTSYSNTGPKTEAPRVVRWFIERPPYVWVIVKTRNVGRGPALIGSDVTDVQLQADYGNPIYGSAMSLVVPSGDFVFLNFVEHSEDPRSLMSLWRIAQTADETTTNGLRVAVKYSDASRSRWTRTLIKFQLQSEGKVSLRLVDFEWDS